jgi:hypothetical protein
MVVLLAVGYCSFVRLVDSLDVVALSLIMAQLDLVARQHVMAPWDVVAQLDLVSK